MSGEKRIGSCEGSRAVGSDAVGSGNRHIRKDVACNASVDRPGEASVSIQRDFAQNGQRSERRNGQ